jgi:hypothetical protein
MRRRASKTHRVIGKAKNYIPKKMPVDFLVLFLCKKTVFSFHVFGKPEFFLYLSSINFAGHFTRLCVIEDFMLTLRRKLK